MHRHPHCISSLGCAELSLEQLYALAVSHGLQGVEVRALAGRVDLPALFAECYGTPHALADLPRPVAVYGLGTSVRLLDATANDVQSLADWAPWADALGARWLRVFDGGQGAEPAELARAAGLWSAWRELRARRGWAVDLIVETHDTLVTAERLADFRMVLPDIGLLWDAHHTWRKGGVLPADLWPHIAPAVRHIHVKDSRDAPQGYTYVLPGMGAFPMAQTRALLAAFDSPIPLSLEWERLWHPHLPPLTVALAHAEAVGWW